MLAKKTVKNQITLPKKVVVRFREVEYFDVTEDGDRIILTPLRKSRADEIRSKLAEIGVTEHDVEVALKWARKTK